MHSLFPAETPRLSAAALLIAALAIATVLGGCAQNEGGFVESGGESY